MQLEGVIVNGRVELDTPADLPEGTRVRIERVAVETPAPETPKPQPDEEPLTSLNKRLLSLSGHG